MDALNQSACPGRRASRRSLWTDAPRRPADACYIVDEARLIENAKILRGVADRTGAKVLLAQKAFSMF